MVSSKAEFQDFRDRARAAPDRRGDERPGHGRPGDGSAHPGQPRSSFALVRDFLGLMRGHRLALVFALLALTVATLIKLVPPLSVKIAIDNVLVESPNSTLRLTTYGLPSDKLQLLFVLAGIVVFTSMLASAIHLSARWFATKTVNRMQVVLRRLAFEHAVRLPLHRVYELKSGGVASLLREDAGGAAELVFSMLFNPCRAVVQLIGSLLILIVVDWRMMIGGLLLIPIVYFTHRTWIRRIRPLWRDVRSQRQSIDATATEAFGGMRIVRAFARERAESSRFVRGNNLLIRKQLFVWWWTRLIDLVWETLIPMASTLLLVYGGYRILQGNMTLGELTMFLIYLGMLLEPLAMLVSSATAFQNNLAGLDRILDLLDEPREMPAMPDCVSLDRQSVDGRLKFEQVDFQYPGSARPVLCNIDLEVAAGETLALVGPSGAGKTTLCNLVARFYDPTKGRILLDGRDLRQIHVESYRRLLGIVEQDVFLFDGTIAENIAYSSRGAGFGKIESAARAANAYEFIEKLEDRFDTLIGERGVKLSGGQRQRLAIARALLAEPRILILDEATSNLDTESEQLIQQSLRVLMQGRTCFLIAHRMSTVALADRVVVLGDGKIVEHGTHQDLMSHRSAFRRMVELQMDSASGGELPAQI